MNQTIFDMIVAGITSKLKIFEELGTPITNDLIEEKIDEIANEYKVLPNFEMNDEDIKLLKFRIGYMLNVSVGEAAISLRNPDRVLWFHNKKHEINWKHWAAYRKMLALQGRSVDILDANEAVINDILDYSGDPTAPGPWARKGLVMGNVQSGKTQSYIGLINKAIDAGYKTVILLGGHLNDLRRQTQERVDEGVLGKKSRHLIDAQLNVPSPIGVGQFHDSERPIAIHSGTTTVRDFNKSDADTQGLSLHGEDPSIFTVKKHTGVLERLYKWIRNEHFLDPSTGKRLEGPLLLIDDEADYASINTKHHKEEVTKTNECIRDLLSLFSRNTYVGYTATPFANVFIDPDENCYSDKDDLFPSDFMIKIPVPDNYLGQDFFFGQDVTDNIEPSEKNSRLALHSPTISITDYEPLYEKKKTDEINEIPESLKEAVRAFILVIAIRSLRGENNVHNTMLVNVSHLQVHQNKLELLIDFYHKEVDAALDAFSELGLEAARSNKVLSEFQETFQEIFPVKEQYVEVFKKLQWASGKVKVWAINQSAVKKDGRELDYSKHKEHGLCAIVIGGHKLSRGLTLEGLSISYFARNSKAYDTLMQMCRWFGYRPNYDDICRVYLPSESIEWYSFISAAIRELYQELDLMSRQEKTPSEFGLKVRDHPGAMIITAKNKVGASDSETRSQDLWGQTQMRFCFRDSVVCNQRNLNFTKEFIQRLYEPRRGSDKLAWDEKSGALVLSDLDYSDLSEYIRNIDLREDGLGNQALLKHLEKMQEAGFGSPRLILFNQGKIGEPDWVKELNHTEKNFVNDPYRFLDIADIKLPKRLMDHKSGFYSVSSVRLGNADDEKLFLKDTERDAVRDKAKGKAVSFDYLCAEGRDYPGLIIYLFAVAVDRADYKKFGGPIRLGHGLEPTVGYSVSLPRPDKLKGKTRREISDLVKKTKHYYQINKVQMQLRKEFDYEEIDDE